MALTAESTARPTFWSELKIIAAVSVVLGVVIGGPATVLFMGVEDATRQLVEPVTLIPNDTSRVENPNWLGDERYVQYGGKTQDGTQLVFYKPYADNAVVKIPAKVGASFTTHENRITVTKVNPDDEAIAIQNDLKQ